jgi:hypothetical protein
MTATRIMAVVEILTWSAAIAAAVVSHAWLALLLAGPVGAFRVSIAGQALRLGKAGC